MNNPKHPELPGNGGCFYCQELILSKFYYDWDQQLSDPVWVTIGNFDGVHLGHQSLIQKLIALAKSEQVKSMAVTFWPHPREFSKEFVGFYLNNSQEKNFLLEKTGLDSILSLNFDSELANLDAAQFLTKLSKVAPLRGLMVGKSSPWGRKGRGLKRSSKEPVNR